MWFRYSQRKMAKLFAKSGDPDQMLQNVASDLGLHCLLITLLGVSRLKWVKQQRSTPTSFHYSVRAFITFGSMFYRGLKEAYFTIG